MDCDSGGSGTFHFGGWYSMTGTDQIFFFGIVIVQVLSTYFGTMLLYRRTSRPSKLALLIIPVLLPVLLLLLTAWMLFGMGRISDLAAMAIGFTLLLSLVLIIAGSIASMVAKRMHSGGSAR
jgi:hypothetical protein